MITYSGKYYFRNKGSQQNLYNLSIFLFTYIIYLKERERGGAYFFHKDLCTRKNIAKRVARPISRIHV